jgi:hypothetical protein
MNKLDYICSDLSDETILEPFINLLFYLLTLELDSKLLIDDLVELHNKGIFTENGQGPLYEITDGGYIHKQRPFLSCFVPIKYLDTLERYLNNNKKKNITNFPQKSLCVTKYKKINKCKYTNYTWLHTKYKFNDSCYIFDCYKNTIFYDTIMNDYFILELTTENFNSKIKLEKLLLIFLMILFNSTILYFFAKLIYNGFNFC